MGKLKVERVGGFAGFGTAKSRIKSTGEMAASALSPQDQTAVDALFAGGTREASGPERDTFRYRITRSVKGKEQTVEVPESAVPEKIKSCVTDKLQ